MTIVRNQNLKKWRLNNHEKKKIIGFSTYEIYTSNKKTLYTKNLSKVDQINVINKRVF